MPVSEANALYHIPPVLGEAVLACLWLFAVLKGGREERFAATALVANVAVTRGFELAGGPHLKWVDLGLDAVLLLYLIGLALRSTKAWPMMAASCQLVDTLTHVAALVDPRVRAWSYLTTIIVWTYALMITIFVATLNHWRAQRYPASARPEAPAAATRR